MVDATKISNKKELDEAYGRCMEEGYEGQIIRLDKPYEHKRSKFLLKRKEFIDSEYEVVEVCEGEGNRTGTAGYMILKLDDTKKYFEPRIKKEEERIADFSSGALEILY